MLPSPASAATGAPGATRFTTHSLQPIVDAARTRVLLPYRVVQIRRPPPIATFVTPPGRWLGRHVAALGWVTRAADPEHRDAAVRDPQCIERVPLGCRQDGDLAEEDDARGPIDQRPRRDPVAGPSRDYIEPVGSVDAVGREHDSHEAIALRR